MTPSGDDLLRPNNQHWHLLRRITIGNLLVVCMFFFSLAAEWYHNDIRMRKLEDSAAEQRKFTDAFLPLIQRQQETLELLEQRLADYPLHRHVDHQIVFPSGVTDPPGKRFRQTPPTR
jgi:hypothetical protein